MGMGKGMGRGGGMGGRGMGRGGRMGMGRGMGGRQVAPSSQAPFGDVPMTSPPISRQQELSFLESQMRDLQRELERVKKRLAELSESSPRER